MLVINSKEKKIKISVTNEYMINERTRTSTNYATLTRYVNCLNFIELLEKIFNFIITSQNQNFSKMSVQGPEPNTSTQTESKRLHLESVEKISNLPVISTGINFTSDLYAKVKVSRFSSRCIAVGYLRNGVENLFN